MSYQAPMFLLATVSVIVLIYGWLCWRQKVASINYPCLVLLVGDQEDYLEGVLRHFFLWCHRSNLFWHLQVITERPSRATLAILHHFFVPYSCAQIAAPMTGMSFAAQLSTAGKTVHCLDIRKEKSFQRALQRLEQVWR